VNREIRQLHRLLIASWALFLVLAILNAVAVSTGWYCGVAR
jgi:hypothetical protein